ncbi:Ninja-family protein [Thalictrum thalictroides]|uniref:Ninja-family protein n=1 Tax=Thalictrum thalictroides TaxID=46969 RepID=A0A7J6XCH7_THATH|nr:Ninja-family protein [Thalictrum thalictroides]
MEDDNGLELSLGLSCGGSNGKMKGKDGSSSDVKIEEGENTNNLMGDLKNFLKTSTQKQDADDGSQRSDPSQSGLQTSKDNFFTNLTKSGPTVDASADLHVASASQFTRYGDIWVENNKSEEVKEVKSDHKGHGGKLFPESVNKRKMLFEETNQQKKYERDISHSDTHAKRFPTVNTSVRASHISLATEDGSNTENEDVAESEVGGLTSAPFLHHEEGAKCYGQNPSNAPPGSDPILGNITYGTTLPPMTVQYSLSSKMSGINGEPSASLYPSSCVMQLMPSASNGVPGSQSANPGNLPLTFGYSPVQLPTLNSERPWGFVSHPMQISSSYAGRNIFPNLERSQDGSNTSRGAIQPPPHSSSEASPNERKALELTKDGGKQHVIKEGASSSTPTEDENKRNSTNQQLEGLLEGSAIRPGIAPGLKFGGSGSCPDLPWVSTTGTGPNGRTISGVTYRFDKNQVRIVCACHGSHMSPEEFLQHASADQQNQEDNTSLATIPNGNPAASAQS